MGFKQSLTSASGEAGPSKKARLNHTTERRPINLPSASAVELERQKYNSAKPYRHASIGGLFDDDLVSPIFAPIHPILTLDVSQLESVVRESRTYGVRGEEGSLPGWGWEQKETDIYKVNSLAWRVNSDRQTEGFLLSDPANARSCLSRSTASSGQHACFLEPSATSARCHLFQPISTICQGCHWLWTPIRAED